MSRFQIIVGLHYVITYGVCIVFAAVIFSRCEKNPKRVNNLVDKVDKILSKVHKLCKLKRKSPHC